MKPAAEYWVLARAPLSEANVAANVLRWGVGGLNIDASRIGHSEPERLTTRTVGRFSGTAYAKDAYSVTVNGGTRRSPAPKGRYPSNLLLSHTLWCTPRGTARVKGITGGTGNHSGSVYGARTNQGQPVQDYADADGLEAVEVWDCPAECPIFILDQQSGVRKSPKAYVRSTDALNGHYSGPLTKPAGSIQAGHGDVGGASRFFARFAYVSKASTRERNQGLDDLPLTTVNDGRDTPIDNPYQRGETKRRNTHPTVKPLELMKYLVRLVTPPNGVVLDPFMGSGSTGLACQAEGFRFIGIEQSLEYCDIARRRMGVPA